MKFKFLDYIQVSIGNLFYNTRRNRNDAFMSAGGEVDMTMTTQDLNRDLQREIICELRLKSVHRIDEVLSYDPSVRDDLMKKTISEFKHEIYGELIDELIHIRYLMEKLGSSPSDPDLSRLVELIEKLRN